MTISVTQLNNYIGGLFDVDGVLNSVSVCGEITNVKQYKDCWYFSLKDDGGAVNCMTFSSAVIPKQGMVAVVDGRVRYYGRNGSVSLYAKKITLSDNKGEAYRRFLELKAKLEAEGIFDEERKVEVPRCCNSVGIVTSPTGAVIRDIEQVALRRQPFVNLILYPAKVQGDGADEEIAEGIRFFDKTGVDVIIVGRGGGSNEDLSVFNSEVIVRAIAACPKPVVSAVGHNVDYTLCDFVADRRAATPSEAAELVTIDVAKEKRLILNELYSSFALIQKRIAEHKRLISSSTYKIGAEIETKITYARRKALRSVDVICSATQRKLGEADAKMRELAAKLSQNNPANILQKGYAYVTDDNGKKITLRASVSCGDKLSLTFADGEVKVTVD